MHTTNKGKGKVFLCSWWWHIRGGMALLHLFFIVAPDGGVWSYFLCCNHFLITQRTPGLDMMLGWLLNQSECFVEVKNILYLRNWTQIF